MVLAFTVTSVGQAVDFRLLFQRVLSCRDDLNITGIMMFARSRQRQLAQAPFIIYIWLCSLSDEEND
jgi:hypothetical protein